MPEAKLEKEEKDAASKDLKSFGAITWLEVRDYFNYYMPGLLWCVDGALGWYLIDADSLNETVETVSKVKETFLVPIAVVVPYLVGIGFAGFGNWVHNVDTWFFGDPENYVLMKPSDHTREKKRVSGATSCETSNDKGECSEDDEFNAGRRRLGYKLSLRIRAKIKKAYPDIGCNSVFPLLRDGREIRSHLGAADKITRLTNLKNLYEGLIAPVILTFALLGFLWLQTQQGKILILLVVLSFLIISLRSRYHYFRVLMAKQVYRIFFLSEYVRPPDEGAAAEGSTGGDTSVPSSK